MNSSLNLTNTFNTETQKLDLISQLAFVKLILVLLARAGFILIEAGCVPTEQFYDLLLPNIIDFSISSASYGLLGCILSFGKSSIYGIIGYGTYSNLFMNHVIYGYCIVIFGSAVITTTISSRLHFIAYLIIIFMYSGITQPILLHWVYNQNGWMKEAIFGNYTAVLHDFGGSLVLNLPCGLISMLGLLVLGRRLLILNNIDEYSLGSESPLLVTLGYFLVIIGYINNYTLVSFNKIENRMFLSVVLAISGGGISSIMVELFVKKLNFNFWLITRLLQGFLIGLTFTSSFIDIIYPPISFLIAFIGGCVISCHSKLYFNLAIQDYCNVHTNFLLPGVWSPIAHAIIVAIGLLKHQLPGEPLYNFLWSLGCMLIILFFIVSIYGFLFLVLWCTGFLRNQSEIIAHKRASNMLRYTTQCTLHHIIDLTEDDDILEPGVSGKTPNEQVHKIQQEENLKCFRIKNFPPKMFSNYSSRNSPQNSIDGLNKNIYTISSNLDAPCGSTTNPLSGGDRVDLSQIFKYQKTVKCKSVNVE
ncbi:ammonium transporter 3-like [Onthophagus taurus]|uniref:ammonium transporter 3-like n=1 Tax=Onthophagus taurus TaxID=166361 RepID=UPI0039BEBE56